ncbi:pyridoxamine 5'-phosphate oxidase family protein [Spirillospora sp. CA-294931]|uniref:pyridoxamine 5'-phosphate oxidase family protein n=1 Tax=Spirillospora sp. CA-294931 TaxID=3240042 RepID=UPI003D91E0F0
MVRQMSVDEREEFLARAHVAVLSVVAEPGRAPLSMPVWYLYEPGGVISVSTSGRSRKMALIRAAGRVSLVAQRSEPPYSYVSVEGVVESVEEPTAPGVRQALADRYLGPVEGAEYIESTRGVADEQVMVRIRPERWLTRLYAD